MGIRPLRLTSRRQQATAMLESQLERLKPAVLKDARRPQLQPQTVAATRPAKPAAIRDERCWCDGERATQAGCGVTTTAAHGSTFCDV
mmetsp:Transcript_26067/g.56298  ORF Transcript_26067/g.56298 Transcript_26067/m.56298 type:complete len:88 (+) Transcript_26067:98-361(+)